MKKRGKNILLIAAIIVLLAAAIFLVVFILTKTSCGLDSSEERIFGLAPKSSSSASECSDHVDNDNDGYCDYKAAKAFCKDGSILGDSDCSSKTDKTERFACSVFQEICDGIDNDCDGLIDENSVCTKDYYCDSDGDSYRGEDIDGTCFSFGCIPNSCSESIGNDCNDNNLAVNPGVLEICNDGIDNDCNEIIDDCVDLCINKIKDGNESDIDCGGGSCSSCETGKTCKANADCLSNNCLQGVCVTPIENLDANCKLLLYKENSTQSHVNIVFVPSGFANDMETFKAKANWVWAEFMKHPPFNISNQRLNAFYVPVENGNYCYFNCSGIDRLLCCDTAKAKQISSVCTSGLRQTVVIHNSTQYGGAGYTSSDVATTSINSNSPKVAVHEVGHSLFNLGDEYDYAGSTAISSPNCDISSCPKWNGMINYKGVGCLGSSCGGGSYYIGEASIMKYLNYPFEEVNLRISCCSYFQETGIYPQYCTQFSQFMPNLQEFCMDINPTVGAAPPFGKLVKAPQVYNFIRNEIGEWVLESITQKRAGLFSIGKVIGEGKGDIRVKITRENGAIKELKFSNYEEVEYPEEKRMGGYTKMPRQTLSIVVNNAIGRVKSIEINGKRMI